MSDVRGEGLLRLDERDDLLESAVEECHRDRASSRQQAHAQVTALVSQLGELAPGLFPRPGAPGAEQKCAQPLPGSSQGPCGEARVRTRLKLAQQMLDDERKI